MTPFILLVAAMIVDACSGGNYQDFNVEENENLIEPKIDLWQLFSKPKGKSSLKNLILSFQQYDTKRKYSSQTQELTPDHIKLLTTNQMEKETTTTTESLKEVIDKVNDKQILGKVYPSLHLQPQDNHRFTHSILDGWIF